MRKPNLGQNKSIINVSGATSAHDICFDTNPFLPSHFIVLEYILHADVPDLLDLYDLLSQELSSSLLTSKTHLRYTISTRRSSNHSVVVRR